MIHALDHFLRQAVRNTGPDKYIRTTDGFCQTTADLAGIGDLGQFFLVACQTSCTSRNQNAVFIYCNDIFDAHAHQHLDDCCTSSTGAILYNADGFHFFARQLQRVDKSRTDYNCSAVLIIMEHRNITDFLQFALDLCVRFRLHLCCGYTAE